jgi:nucleoside-diphosphate-sugar epimerase
VNWVLGQDLPQACHEVDCLLHLACATLSNTVNLEEAAALDLRGTLALVERVRRIRQEGHAMRFIFLSSQSARPKAANIYGRSKWAIEQTLNEDDEIIVRAGLVYGPDSTGVSKLFERLAMLPLVPSVRTAPSIQPIEVSELAECLLRVASEGAPAKVYRLGAITPLTLGDAILATAERLQRRPPIILPLPQEAIRLAGRLLDLPQFLRPSLSERIDGLVGLESMLTERSLSDLGYVLSPFNQPIGQRAQRPSPAASTRTRDF